eukprot:CAMPEP_0204824986 /NCGR_PEP_ID=MMETSP1346-20131115/2963_1 /ASSEMBLY_ACC=CAM_ASM_000771 /TAXON_ID=215587 /ORGANISM="Aplanochytrium stocchinoi, Strain GSBS06" /LENGTH=427 /DNA_ID=CAMNT_0051952443 /DNA_START=253 /DNA_END=1539 /DNA_ORIENTATION=+
MAQPYVATTEPVTKYVNVQANPAYNYGSIPIATATPIPTNSNTASIPIGNVADTHTGSTVPYFEGAPGQIRVGENSSAAKVAYSIDEKGSKNIDCVVVTPPPVLKSDTELVNEFKQQLAQAGQGALDEIPTDIPVALPVIGTEDFFTLQEIQILDAIPAQGTQQPTQGPQDYALQPTNAIPIIPNAYTTVRVSSDWLHSGIKTRDMDVASSKEEIYAFLNAYNTRPQVFLEIEGYRMKTRVVTGTQTDANGNVRSTTRTETYKVTDFRYGVDITQFVYPYGKIASKDGTFTTEEYMERFANDRNKLKALRMKKVIIGFDFNFLESQVRAYLRALGYRHSISVRTHTRNKSVRIVSNSRLASFWDNPAARILSWVTLVPGLSLTLYGAGHRGNQLYSHFIMRATPVQIFAAIRPQLWVTGVYRGCVIS